MKIKLLKLFFFFNEQVQTTWIDVKEKRFNIYVFEYCPCTSKTHPN